MPWLLRSEEDLVNELVEESLGDLRGEVVDPVGHALEVEEGIGAWIGRSGSIVRAPGVVERRLMSRRASTSRCMSYSEGCRVREDMGWGGRTERGRVGEEGGEEEMEKAVVVVVVVGNKEWYLDTSCVTTKIMYVLQVELASPAWLLGERSIFAAELQDDSLRQPINTRQKEEEMDRQRGLQDSRRSRSCLCTLQGSPCRGVC